MRTERVLRRFEIQAAADNALTELDRRLREAVAVLLPNDPRALEVRRWDGVPIMSVRIAGPADVLAKLGEIASRARQITVHRDDLELVASSVGRDYPDRRALLKIDPEGLSKTITGSERPVVVAIVDSGVAVDHPDLKDHLWTESVDGRTVHGACRMGRVRDDDVADQDGHGTMLAGTILGTANRVQGLTLVPVKFFDVVTQPTASNAAEAIDFAVRKGANIINLSFDLGLGSNELRDAIRMACRAGALAVMAAGNTGSDNDRYPTVPVSYARECPERIITVMATDWSDTKPAFSNFGAQTVDLAAPGVDIVSTRRLFSSTDRRRYGRYTGTSAAAAHVTGAAALLLAQNPDWGATQLRACLTSSVDAVPSLKGLCRTGGRLNLGRALTQKA